MSTLRTALGRFGAVAIALICVQLDYFALALALPNMAADLKTTPENLQWSVSAYMIALGITMVPGSRLADLVGRKRIVLIGLTIFGLASLWCGLSTTTESVIAARIVQGFGAGLYFPVAFALVSNATDDVGRPKILGLLSGIAGIGTAAGPILGGAFSSTIGWRWVFFVNVPIAAAGVIWGFFQLREQTDPGLADKRVRDLDFLGIALIALLVGGLSLALDDLSAEAGSLLTVVPAVVGVGALVGFILWERRTPWPILPPRLWRNERFTALVIAATIANAGLCVMIFLATLYLQQTRGLSGLTAGLLFIPAAIGLSIGGPISGRIASRYPGQRVMTVAMIAGAFALAALAFAQNLAVYLLLMAVASFFLGLGFQFGNIAVQSVVDLSEAGAAAGVLLTVMVTTGGVGVVAAAASLEAFGDGGTSGQFATTVTYLEWAVLVGVLGVVFGLWQWRKATMPAAPTGDHRGAAAARATEDG